jgi:nucleoside-diphosphate-sugar epimerase
MRVLVTGVAGFIAARTTELLLQSGHEVVGVDNLNNYYDIRLKLYRLQSILKLSGADQDILDQVSPEREFIDSFYEPSKIKSDNFEFNLLDIESKKSVRELFEKYQFDAVLNLAARAGVRYSMIDPDVYMRTNAMGTLNLMDAMRDTGCKKMVLASTSSLYAGQPMPFSEDLPVNTPISPYAASKKAAEMLAYSYHHLYNLDISVVRYFTVFGPAGRPDMSIFRFIKWIDEGQPIELFGDGSQSRDFTYVDDIAKGTIEAMKPLGYEVINLGGGNNPISLNKIIEFIENSLNKTAKINHRPFHIADIKETWADIDKAKAILKWSPSERIFEGVQKSINWFEDNRCWASKVVLG